jgi:elongation factor Ts
MAITAADVSKLRKMTGAGMMDCKKALTEAEGDFDKAVEIIRKKGQAVASKRADRDATEGVVLAKVSEDGKNGALVVLNCETDFVARNEHFQVLIKDIAMHIAAMNPLAVSSDQLDQSDVDRERAVFEEQVKDKPENIQGNIVEGKLQKYYSEVCLLNQAFIKDDKKSIEQLIQDAIALIGENIQLTRFHRLEIGQ